MELLFSLLGYGFPGTRNVDYPRAWQYLVRAADEARYGPARYTIHEYYKDGDDERFGIEQDHAKAMSYLRKGAMENGDASCIYELQSRGLWEENEGGGGDQGGEEEGEEGEEEEEEEEDQEEEEEEEEESSDEE